MGISNEEIFRINELYHKSKTSGLTDEEKEEQKVLRKKYVDSVVGNLRGQLDNVNIQESDGSITHLRDKRKSWGALTNLPINVHRST